MFLAVTQAESKPFDPDYQWAGSVSVGYDIPMSANNIEVNYLYLKNKTHAVNTFANGSTLFGSILFPDAFIPRDFLPDLVSDAYLTYRIDQADVRAGENTVILPEYLKYVPHWGFVMRK